MLDIVIWILTALDVIVAILLIPLILVQKTKDGGFGSSFGGMGESVFGAHAASHLTKLTVVLAATFLIVTLSLTVISGHRSGAKKGIAEKSPELFVTPPGENKEGAANNVTPGTTTAKKPETDQNAESTETLPDGTVIKKVPGGTIKMTPVKKPEGTTPPPSGENKVPSPAGTVTVNPPQPGDANKTESVEKLPDGTIIKKVPGGTIKMTPVKKPEGMTPPPAGGNKVVAPAENPLPQPKPAEEKKQENPLPAEGK